VALGKPENTVTFGDFANRYASAVLMASSNYQRIDVVFDRYREDTIKSSTRIRRSKTSRPIRRIIVGRDVGYLCPRTGLISYRSPITKPT